MQLTQTVYGPESLRVLTRAFDAAWHEVQRAYPGRSPNQLTTTRKMMALRILDAAKNGESDPERLKAVALRAIDGRNFD